MRSPPQRLLSASGRVRLPTPRRYRSGRVSPTGFGGSCRRAGRGSAGGTADGASGYVQGGFFVIMATAAGTGERARSVDGACVSDSLGGAMTSGLDQGQAAPAAGGAPSRVRGAKIPTPPPGLCRTPVRRCSVRPRNGETWATAYR